MRILFLNQYFPPDPAPTGVLLSEIADGLTAAGHEVVFVSSGQDYRAGQKQGSRLKRELRALRAIFDGARRAGKVDAVVSGSSPPMLAVAAGMAAKLKGARHYHWLFDMYPELASALGEIREGVLFRVFSMAMGWAYRGARAVAALDEDMAERLRGYGVKARIVPPWVLGPLMKALAATPAHKSETAAEPAWLYSGNLGRAHEWKTLLDAQKILEERGAPWRLVFQGGGPSWPAAREYAEKLGLSRCEWRPYVAEDQLPASLLAAEVLVVTQKPETCGLLWPSKLALVTSLPRPILWVGPADRAIARDLKQLPQAGVVAPGDAAGVAAWLSDEALGREFTLRDPAAYRTAAIRDWVDLITG